MQISALSTYDYITLIAHYNRLQKKDRVDPRLLTRGFTEDQLKQLQKTLGKSPDELISLNLHFKTDLTKFNYPHFNYVFRLYDRYNDAGVLPFKGSHSDQPAQIMEIFSVLEQLQMETQKELHEENQRKQARERKQSGRR